MRPFHIHGFRVNWRLALRCANPPRIVLSYQDKTRRRLRYALLFSLIAHALLLISVGFAPPSLPGHGSGPSALNVTLEKGPGETPRPAANEAAGQESAGAQPLPAPAATAPPAAPKPPAVQPAQPQPAATASSETPARQDILAIEKPETEKQAERAASPPAPPQPAEQEQKNPPIALSGAAAAPKPAAAETPARPETPPAAPMQKTAEAAPAEKPPVRLEPPAPTPPAKIEPLPTPPTPPAQPAPPKTEPPRPVQPQPPQEAARPPQPATTETSEPSLAQTGKAVELREKPAGNDVSALAGMDISSIRHAPPEGSGPKIRFGERRKVIGLREEDLTYQLYAESVRLKLERVGRFNYPIEAARRGLSGTLVVLISIRPDGSLENFSISQPSYDVLNAGADRIVHMAAPFSPLPDRILQDTDILTIRVIWTFSSSDQSFQ